MPVWPLGTYLDMPPPSGRAAALAPGMFRKEQRIASAGERIISTKPLIQGKPAIQKPVHNAKEKAGQVYCCHSVCGMFVMAQYIEIATLNRAVERIRSYTVQLEARCAASAARLSQPVLSDYELWREAASQRRAFARRLKNN